MYRLSDEVLQRWFWFPSEPACEQTQFSFSQQATRTICSRVSARRAVLWPGLLCTRTRARRDRYRETTGVRARDPCRLRITVVILRADRVAKLRLRFLEGAI